MSATPGLESYNVATHTTCHLDKSIQLSEFQSATEKVGKVTTSKAALLSTPEVPNKCQLHSLFFFQLIKVLIKGEN